MSRKTQISLFFLIQTCYNDVRVKRSKCRLCLHKKAFNLGPAKHEKAAVSYGNVRISNVYRVLDVRWTSVKHGPKRSGDCGNCGAMEQSVDISWGKIPFDPNIL